ncbi:MAG TPA: uroporphyrinogen decarboxylase family protein, partial [bacterium]|nr:uroporphyrinogen decarboxylase family protein [bacterium]
ARELASMRARFPEDFASPAAPYAPAARARGIPNRRGTYTDEWGCAWDVSQDGVVGEVKHPPLADWAALDSLVAPREMLQGDWAAVDAGRARTDRYVLAGTTVRPFERMQFLRGTENIFADMGWGDQRFLKLRALVHEFFVEEMTLWAQRDVDGISFMDDWGTQVSLLISPAMWREYFKPLYADYTRIIRAAGKHVFFHSDGNIQAIIPDLVEIGVHALNSQLFCMDIEEIALKHKGRITFWGEIDRQKVLPFGTPAEVRGAVRRVRAALDDGRGGVVAQCEWGIHDPAENIAAVFEAWDTPL